MPSLECPPAPPMPQVTPAPAVVPEEPGDYAINLDLGDVDLSVTNSADLEARTQAANQFHQMEQLKIELESRNEAQKRQSQLLSDASMRAASYLKVVHDKTEDFSRQIKEAQDKETVMTAANFDDKQKLQDQVRNLESIRVRERLHYEQWAQQQSTQIAELKRQVTQVNVESANMQILKDDLIRKCQADGDQRVKSCDLETDRRIREVKEYADKVYYQYVNESVRSKEVDDAKIEKADSDLASAIQEVAVVTNR